MLIFVAVMAVVAFVMVLRLYPPPRVLLYGVVTAFLSLVIALIAVASFDVYLHHRYFRSGGYNLWGYRGTPVGKKRDGERRLVMLGGSVAFGYGVDVDEAIPAYLQHELPNRTVINLGWNSEGAYAFPSTLDDYAYLGYDDVVLYSGYNDLFEPNHNVFRHTSPIFQLTGYMPILPIIPMSAWLHLSDLSHSSRVIFQPTLADRASARATSAANHVQLMIDAQLSRFAKQVPRPQPADNECGPTWSFYCEAVRQSAVAGRAHGAEVFIVGEPWVSESYSSGLAAAHATQQAVLSKAIGHWFKDDPHVKRLSLGDAVDLGDPALCYDGLHLTATGNKQAARALAAVLNRHLQTGGPDRAKGRVAH